MSNSFYNHGAFPSTGSAATSASMRAELDLVAAGFDKMPTLSGNANKFVVVNSTGTALTQTSTLPSFTVTDTDFTVQDDGDNTRKFQFNAGTVTPGATRIYSVPDANTTLVGTDTTQTLTNKTLTAPVISSIVNTGSLSLPTSTDTLVGRATTDTLTNKTLTSPVIGTIVNTGTLTLPTSTDTLVGRATTDTLTNKTLTSPVIGTIVNTGTLTLPTSTDTLVGRATTDTLTNKTLTSPVIGTIVNTGTLTLPTSTDTLVGRATTDTLTNKTLTSPVIGTIVNTGTLTLPTSTDTLVGRSTTDTLTNKTLGAFTISGTVSGGGNQINNVIIGTSNPLAGTFTDLNTTGLVKIPSANRSAAAALTPTNPAFLYGVASTYTDTSSSGPLTPIATFYSLAQPTLSTNNVTTYTTAATLYLANAPVAGGFATITNAYSLYVAAGASYFGGAVTFASSVGALTVSSLTNTGLTSGRVPYSTTAGLQTDSANLTFNGTTLTANTIGAFTLGGTVAGGGNQINNVIIGTTNPLAGAFTTITASTSITNSGLTSGRVPYSTTAGLQTDSANLTFNGTTLTANTIGAFTLGGTVAGGGNQINNVIIGTTNPLAGSFTTLTATVANNAAYQTAGAFTNAVNADFLIQVKTSYTQIGPSTTTPLSFAIAGSEKLTLSTGGYLGVGTATPTTFVHALGGAASGVNVINWNARLSTGAAGSSAFGNVGTGIYFDSYTNSDTQPIAGVSSYLESGGSGGVATNFSGGITFWTKNGANASITRAATIDKDGYFGLGVTTLALPFDVAKTGVQVGATTAYTIARFREAVPNKGVTLGYDSGSQTGIVLSETTGAASNLAFWTYSGSAWGERSRINSNGTLLVGTTTETNNIRLGQKLALVNTSSYGGASIVGYEGTLSGTRPLFDINRSRGTTDGSMTAVTAEDYLGSMLFRGADGTNFLDSSMVSGEVDGVVSTGNMPGRLSFHTADTTGGVVERMRINAQGTVGVNVVPNSWYKGSSASTVQVYRASMYSDSSNSGFFGNNYLLNASGTEQFMANGYANRMLVDTGAFKFQTSSTVNATGGVANIALMKTVANIGVNGDMTLQGNIFPAPSASYTISTNTWVANTFYEIITPGNLANYTTYWITVRWDHGGGGGAFIMATAFMFSVVNTNGTGADNTFTPLTSSHTGGGGILSFRSRAANGATTGLEAAANVIVGGTMSVNIYRFV
jgi:hypothetical protein